MKWIFLLIAIIAEVIATSALKESTGFTKLIPSLVCIIGYSVSFYFLALTLKEMPIGITYAVWSGVGIFFMTMVGYYRFDQKLDLPAILGIGLIVFGVLVINLFSKSVSTM